MKIYLRILSVFYFLGAFLHLLDMFNLRLNFSTMTPLWKAWIAFLFVSDMVAAIGMWKLRSFGEYAFLLIAGAQIFAYSFFSDYFGQQQILIVFHLVTVTVYAVLKLKLIGRTKL